MSELLSEALRRKGLECLWYLTHIENVASILEHGILSYNRAREMKLLHRSIANPGVQARRTTFAGGLRLHDFVPLYMARRNPMLWVVKDHPLAYVRVSLDVTDKKGTFFSDGNAASEDTRFFEKQTDVDCVPWDVILGPKWTGSAVKNGTRKRCSEVLVPDMVETQFFLDIRCNKALENLSVPSQFRSLLKFDPESLNPSKAKRGIALEF